MRCVACSRDFESQQQRQQHETSNLLSHAVFYVATLQFTCSTPLNRICLSMLPLSAYNHLICLHFFVACRRLARRGRPAAAASLSCSSRSLIWRSKFKAWMSSWKVRSCNSRLVAFTMYCVSSLQCTVTVCAHAVSLISVSTTNELQCFCSSHHVVHTAARLSMLATAVTRFAHCVVIRHARCSGVQ